MSTLVIGLFITGAAIAYAIRLTLRAEPGSVQPATPVVAPGRADAGAAAQDVDPISGLRRARSGFLLLVTLTVLGVLLALLVLVGGAIVLTGLRSAVQ